MDKIISTPSIKQVKNNICSFINSGTYKKSTIYAGYNSIGQEIFYVKRGNKIKEVPFSWEIIMNEGFKKALEFIAACNPQIVMDAKSYALIQKGYFEEN